MPVSSSVKSRGWVSFLGLFSYYTLWIHGFLLSLSVKFNFHQESISSPLELGFILYVLNVCLYFTVSIFPSLYSSFILWVRKGSIFSNFPKELKESLIFGSLPLRACSLMPAIFYSVPCSCLRLSPRSAQVHHLCQMVESKYIFSCWKLTWICIPRAWGYSTLTL